MAGSLPTRADGDGGGGWCLGLGAASGVLGSPNSLGLSGVATTIPPSPDSSSLAPCGSPRAVLAFEGWRLSANSFACSGLCSVCLSILPRELTSVAVAGSMLDSASGVATAALGSPSSLGLAAPLGVATATPGSPDSRSLAPCGSARGLLAFEEGWQLSANNFGCSGLGSVCLSFLPRAVMSVAAAGSVLGSASGVATAAFGIPNSLELAAALGVATAVPGSPCSSSLAPCGSPRAVLAFEGWRLSANNFACSGLGIVCLSFLPRAVNAAVVELWDMVCCLVRHWTVPASGPAEARGPLDSSFSSTKEILRPGSIKELKYTPRTELFGL